MARFFRWWRQALFALLALAVLPAVAQDDPPGRIGRIAELQGQVWYYDLESGDWVTAVRNRPLTTGDRVATDGDGRVEIRIGSSTIRLGAGSEIDFQQIDDDRVRVQLHSGQLALRLRSHEAAREFELVTEEGRFKPDRAGRYRLDRVDATTSATVWSGQLLFEAPDNAATITAGQRAEVIRSAGRTQYTLLQPQRDAFSDEVAAAEGAAERSVTTTRYVSPEMTGAEALESQGRWIEDAEQGPLWIPRAVVPGWAPYRFGHWAFIRPWGWTWVDDAPWGFAPFHYGRWVFWRNTWCWAPGRWVARPVYAPALVAWVGAPLAGVSVSINVGPSIGWFPLGPREVFVPGYRVSPRYVQNVNVTHVTNITNITQIVNSPNTVVQQTNYIHRGAPGAVTVVPASVVSGRQPVAPARVQLRDPDMTRPADRRMALAAQSPVMTVPPVAPPTMAPAPAASPRPRPAITRPVAAIPGHSNSPAAPQAAPAATEPGTAVPRPASRPQPQPAISGTPSGRSGPPTAVQPSPAAGPQAAPLPPMSRPLPPMSRPEAPMVRPEVQTTRPDVPIARPEPPMARPDTPISRPQAPAVRPESSMARPQPSMTRPEPQMSRPEPQMSRQDAPATRPQAVPAQRQAAPQPAQVPAQPVPAHPAPVGPPAHAAPGATAAAPGVAPAPKPVPPPQRPVVVKDDAREPANPKQDRR